MFWTIMGGVCLIDAVRFLKLYATARTCVRQLASSDIAVVNKTDRASPEQLAGPLALIQGQRPGMPLVQTSFGRVGPEILDTLAGARALPAADMPLTADLTLRQLNIRIAPAISAYALQKFIEMFAENTFRVKGFIQTCDQGMVLADCVGNVVSVKPVSLDVPEEKRGWLTVLSGAGMPVRKAVREACRWYAEMILETE